MSKSEMWDRLEKTDPARTKPFTKGGGFKGTAINATYIIKRLTEEFGPCGKGWVFVLEEERVEEGHALKSGDRARVHIVRGHIKYRPDFDGVWYETSPQFGQTMLVDENKNGTFTDEEAPKKSITDCISKCAVLLGIGADVHLGLFDDNKYVNQRKAEEAGENGNGHTEPNPPQGPIGTDQDKKAIATQWGQAALGIIQGAKTYDELGAWHRHNADHIARVRGHNEALHKRILMALDKKQSELRPVAAE